MDQEYSSFVSMVKKPSALVPITMSLIALALLGGAYVFGLAAGRGGLVREPDEGAIAHLWQLLMAGQLPVLVFFAVKWLPRAPKQTLYVLALQAASADRLTELGEEAWRDLEIEPETSAVRFESARRSVNFH